MVPESTCQQKRQQKAARERSKNKEKSQIPTVDNSLFVDDKAHVSAAIEVSYPHRHHHYKLIQSPNGKPNSYKSEDPMEVRIN